MIAFILSPLGRKLASLLAVIVACALTVMAIFNAGADHGRKPAEADRNRWKATATAYLGAAHAWEASYRQDARFRGQERAEAIAALNSAAKACDARVAVARRSAIAIQSIVTKETTYDQAHCPVRAVVRADQLSDALGLVADRR